MTPLRAKYIGDLVIHGRSKHTQEAYTRYVCDLARYYRRSPELISYEQDRFDLAARVNFRAPGGALHVRDRCHQVERLSPKCHGVEEAHGADGDVDAGG